VATRVLHCIKKLCSRETFSGNSGNLRIMFHRHSFQVSPALVQLNDDDENFC
jgi:hypothetical protein